jgi:hypothetical protein
LASYSATSGTVVRVGDTLNWTIGNLAISNRASLTLNFHTALNAAGLYTNSATVYSSTSDPNPDENVAAATLFVSGTAPPPPQLSSSYNSAAGIFQLTVSGSNGQSVILQTSTNLFNWVPISTNLVPFTNFFTVTNYPAQFYRAVVGP